MWGSLSQCLPAGQSESLRQAAQTPAGVQCGVAAGQWVQLLPPELLDPPPEPFTPEPFPAVPLAPVDPLPLPDPWALALPCARPELEPRPLPPTVPAPATPEVVGVPELQPAPASSKARVQAPPEARVNGRGEARAATEVGSRSKGKPRRGFVRRVMEGPGPALTPSRS